MQQISTEGVQGETRLDRQGYPLGNVHEISIQPYKQMVYVQPRICPKKWQQALLRTARILRRVLETWGDLLSLRLQWKTIS